MWRAAAVLGALAALLIGASVAPGQQTVTVPGFTTTIPEPKQKPRPTPKPKPKRKPPAGAKLIGRSVKGRPISVRTIGPADAPHKLMIVGCVHGTERAGEAVVRRLRDAQPPPGTALLLIDQANPDGCAAGTRGNAHGVDLNRNSRWRWKPLKGIYYSGPRPLSEPESRAINAFVKRERPDVSIWYHQHANLVDTSLGDLETKRVYSRATGLPLRDYGTRPGSITSWQESVFPASAPFVVELPAGRLSEDAVRRHVAAVLEIAATLG